VGGYIFKLGFVQKLYFLLVFPRFFLYRIFPGLLGAHLYGAGVVLGFNWSINHHCNCGEYITELENAANAML